MPRPTKVLLAMSGGVDSSVAAALLQRAGHEVVGCFMRLGSPGEPLGITASNDGTDDGRDDGPSCGTGGVRIGHQGCCSINDAADARQVAARLGIPFYVCNFKRDFGRIIDYFVDEYNAGRTPNPCVRCNDWLKFGRLHEYAAQIDADVVASGHYARIEHHADGPHLLRGLDHGKDQSYVLFGVPRGTLARMLLPIGDRRKSEVRELAREFDLPVFDKPDSQEICFVPDNDYAALVARRRPGAVRPGDLLDESGRVVGQHPGQQHFTIGQRRGVGVAFGYPIYVVDRDPVANTVTVGPRESLARTSCVAGEANWLVEASSLPADSEGWIRCGAMTRYNSVPAPARVRPLPSPPDGVREPALEVRFDAPQEAVAPGQAVVCYDDERVLCGGWIDAARRGRNEPTDGA